MTTTSAVNNTSSTTGSSSSTGTNPLGTQLSAQDQSDRFLKLLVAQMSNQDPLNPMDSAEVTSQMAQISTVEGVQTLNTSINNLGTQFTQMQTMQGAALVGKDVATEGNSVRVNPTTNVGDGGFELASNANSVSVDIVDASGKTIATENMGALGQGRHSFSYDVPAADQGQALTFKVTATSGSGSTATAVDSMALQYNDITAVSTLNGSLALELDNGQRVSYDAVWAFL
jgi:flagellar basal-body rod modification protein FlgD